MKLVNSSIEQTQNKNVYQVGLAIDSQVYYAALVDRSTGKCYAEEVGLAGKNTVGFQGVYRKIDDDQAWQTVVNFFRRAGVYDKFLKGRNWYWSRMNGNDIIPPWFIDKFK